MKVFTIKEIQNFLKTQESIEDAIANLTERNIIDAIPVDDFESLNGEITQEKLERYEEYIGMTKQKAYQRTLYRQSNGAKGRYWMALSPRVVDNDSTLDTKFKICYWVNYGDDNTYGLFTVEQIQKWFDNPEIQLHELGGTKER